MFLSTIRHGEMCIRDSNQGIVPANAIEMVVDQSLEDGSAVKSTLMQMSRALESDPKAAYATYVKAGKDYSCLLYTSPFAAVGTT